MVENIDNFGIQEFETDVEIVFRQKSLGNVSMIMKSLLRKEICKKILLSLRIVH